VNRRVKKISYARRKVRGEVFSRFREHFLDPHYPGDAGAARLFRKDLKKLSANFSGLFFFQYSLWSRYRFHRHIYRSVILSGAHDHTLEDVVRASRDGVLFYFPNHQAHIDSMVISWVARELRVPQPMFIAWNTLARRRSSYLMPLVNSCLLDREVMDNRFHPSDPFRDTRSYRAGYARLFNEYLKYMLSHSVDTLIYPEGGRSYSGKTGEARIRRVYKSAGQAQDALAGRREVFIVPVSLTFTLVPEDGQLIRAFHEGTFLPPSSLFHDMQHGDDRYAAFRPNYETTTGFPVIRHFTAKRTPIFCVLGDPISLADDRPSLQECFNVVKRNLRILPHHFVARLILSDKRKDEKRWVAGERDAMLEPARSLRHMLPEHRLDAAYFDESGLGDILSIGLEFFRCEGAITAEGNIRDPLILEYYAARCDR
jgi:1-acyl-sn-glycerol-3-phosphate acyltransferase